MRYIALGDSISIDDYPQHETGTKGLGAATLLHRNDDAYWPEFRGHDLSTLYPGIALQNLAADGATTDDVIRHQLPRIVRDDSPAIVTVTAGGNDMLMHLRSPAPLVRLVESMIERISRIVQSLEAALPASLILLGNVYDPSDGTNELYGERMEREAGWLARFNEAVGEIAASHARVRLTDIHHHFLGHGVTVPQSERWYWSGLIFEPNARGASEVRRLWLQALGAGSATGESS